jgi:N-acetylmuramic acid 6-phosphate etherase
VVGPEFLTGSTRMKSGTAQKMVLNMISTTIMIKLGRIEGNKMVNMQLTNQKLFDRGVKMIMDELNMHDASKAAALLSEYGSVKKSIDNYKP